MAELLRRQGVGPPCPFAAERSLAEGVGGGVPDAPRRLAAARIAREGVEPSPTNSLHGSSCCGLSSGRSTLLLRLCIIDTAYAIF